METIESIIRDTTARITSVVRESFLASLEPRVRKMERRVDNAHATTRLLAKITKSGKPRRKGPVQLCPAPGCKERAAPVFGMLCAEHKGTAKSTVAKWRAARRVKTQTPVKAVAKTKLAKKS